MGRRRSFDGGVVAVVSWVAVGSLLVSAALEVSQKLAMEVEYIPFTEGSMIL